MLMTYKMLLLFHTIAFADDTNLFMSAPSIESLHGSINTELNKIENWLRCNRLCLNVSKTCYQIYSKKLLNKSPDIRINNICIKRENVVKFLGIIVDEQLSFKHHIENISRKFAIGLGFLYRGREVLDCKELQLLYNSVLLPHLTYCNLVWGINYPTNLNKLQQLQKRAARVILGLKYGDPVSHRLHELKMLSINQLVKKRCLMMIYKIKHSLVPLQMRYLLNWRMDNSALPCVRRRGLLIVPFAKTKYKHHTFKLYAPKLLNELSALNYIDLDVPISKYKVKVTEIVTSSADPS